MKRLAGMLVVLCIAVNALAAGWRGDGNGVYPDARVMKNWLADENVVWKTETGKGSNASPALGADRVFVCVEPATLLCLSKADGKVLWQADHPFESFLTEEEQTKVRENAPRIKECEGKIRQLRGELKKIAREIEDEEARKAREAELKAETETLKKELAELSKYAPPKTHGSTGYSSPSPVCDGERVFTVFGTGAAACHALDGARKWTRRLGRPSHNWGHSSSPLIVNGRVIVKVRDTLALDAETGKEIWSVPGQQVFGSLVHTRLDGKDLVVTAEGQVIDIANGQLISSGLHKLAYSSPIVQDGIAYFIEHGGKAVKLSATPDSKPEVLWTTEPAKNRYYASPVYHKGLLYAVTRSGQFSVIDAADGRVIHERKFKLKPRETCYASVTMAGTQLLIWGDHGSTFVLEPGPEAPETASYEGDGYRSTPAFEGGRMYLRTGKHVYCVGTKPE